MVKEVQIREYQERDWEEIKLFILESDYYGPSVLKREKTRIEFYSQVPEKGRTFVATVSTDDSENDSDKSDKAVGYIVIDFFGRGIFILSLIIAREWQRQGIGTKLLSHVRKIGEDDPQYSILRGFADDRSYDVHSFMLKQGFITCGHIFHDLDWGHSTIHYVLPLNVEEDGSEILISA